MPWPWKSWNYYGGNNDRKFEVVIYEEDYKELCAHVLRKPNIETGGDLFGLWVDEYKAVVQLALGPGQECRRTSTSFYQDVEYLKNVGSYLTQHEGLCHIGEWHSHHQLGLARPSGGDENTVWNNMPTYKLSKFVIFIANIEASHKSYKVNIGCFLFEIDSKGNELPVLQGEFKILPFQNPFSRKTEVRLRREKGAEKLRGKEANIDIEILKLTGERESPFVTMMRRNFEVVIYEEDYSKLCAWVLEKPNIETGGDLFGLWVDEYKAIIQVTLGPGQSCRRTSCSFYQDVEYLEKVGSYLTQNEGLCHIGEWHSHHQLGLPRPSGGDENTVWNNMPTYKLSKFVIFIANIEASFCNMLQGVNVNCFLFETDWEGHRLPVLQGEFKILQSENPFSRKKEVDEKRNEGAERLTEKRINPSSEWNGNYTKQPKTERNERYKYSTPGTKQENHANSGGCASAVQLATSGHENRKGQTPDLPLRRSDPRDSKTPGYKDKEPDGVKVEPPEVNKGSSGSETKTETSEPNISGMSLEVDQHSSDPKDTETPGNKNTEPHDVTAKPQEVNKGSSGSEDKTQTSEPNISSKNLEVYQHSSEPKDSETSGGKDKKPKGSTTSGPAAEEGTEEEESKDDEGEEERSGSTEDEKIYLQPSNSEAEKEKSAERYGGPGGADDMAESIRTGRDDNRERADLLSDVKMYRNDSGDSETADEEHTREQGLTTAVPAAGQSEEKADRKADEDAKNKNKRELEKKLGGKETQKHLKEKTKTTEMCDYQESKRKEDYTSEKQQNVKL